MGSGEILDDSIYSHFVNISNSYSAKKKYKNKQEILYFSDIDIFKWCFCKQIKTRTKSTTCKSNIDCKVQFVSWRFFANIQDQLTVSFMIKLCVNDKKNIMLKKNFER